MGLWHRQKGLRWESWVQLYQLFLVSSSPTSRRLSDQLFKMEDVETFLMDEVEAFLFVFFCSR